MAYEDAAEVLSHMLTLDPGHSDANYVLGLIHLHGYGTTKGGRLGLKLLDIARTQGYFEAAFKGGCTYAGLGEWLQAQRAFEADCVRTGQCLGSEQLLHTTLASLASSKAMALGPNASSYVPAKKVACTHRTTWARCIWKRIKLAKRKHCLRKHFAAS